MSSEDAICLPAVFLGATEPKSREPGTEVRAVGREVGATLTINYEITKIYESTKIVAFNYMSSEDAICLPAVFLGATEPEEVHAVGREVGATPI